MDCQCAACDKLLSECETIFAAEGHLYCSRDCGIHDFKVAYDNEAADRFDESCEELTPQEIGITKYMTAGDIYNTIHSLAQSQGSYSRLFSRLNELTEVNRKQALDELAKHNFEQPVDLILFLEGGE